VIVGVAANVVNSGSGGRVLALLSLLYPAAMDRFIRVLGLFRFALRTRVPMKALGTIKVKMIDPELGEGLTLSHTFCREGEVDVGWVVVLESHLYGICEKTAMVACSLTGATALASPRQTDMVRDNVGEVNEHPLAAPFDSEKLEIWNAVRWKKSAWALLVLRSGMRPVLGGRCRGAVTRDPSRWNQDRQVSTVSQLVTRSGVLLPKYTGLPQLHLVYWIPGQSEPKSSHRHLLPDPARRLGSNTVR
jgi:hypothetical protein